MRKALLVAIGAAVILSSCSPSKVESAAKNGEWGCLAGTAAGAVAGAVVGSFFAKGLGGGNVARTLTGAGGAVGGGALGQKLACK